MNLIARAAAAIAAPFQKRTLSSVPARGGNWLPIFDWKPGAWQQDAPIAVDTTLSNWAVFACMTLIAADVGKLRLVLAEKTRDGIWEETSTPAFSPVLRKPNNYQTRQQFLEAWMLSKLTNGNTYVLKVRNQNRVVDRLYVLDPTRVTPLVSDTGEVYYQLDQDEISNLPQEQRTVLADDIIHDRMNCLFHPLVGLSPIFASGVAALQGLHIQKSSSDFFKKGARPAGVLTAPAQIGDDTAKRIKDYWEREYRGLDGMSKIAVLGDGLKYESMTMTAVDAEVIAQLKMTAEMICSTFHVPAFKIQAGTIPAGQKVEDLNQIYYADCLQAHIEAIENLLDDGLGIGEGATKDSGRTYGTMFLLEDLLKMDMTSQVTALKTAKDASIMSPNEARKKLNLPPVAGGAQPLSQQQQYSLEALAKRDASGDPFGTNTPAAPAPDPEDESPTEVERQLLERVEKAEATAHETLALVRSLIETRQKDDEAQKLKEGLEGAIRSVRNLRRVA